MTKTYIIKRESDGISTFVGKFNDYTFMFDTGTTPYEFSAINVAIKVADTLNMFIPKGVEPYRVFELTSTDGKDTQKPPKEVVEEEHGVEIEE